jgi:dienelactone hydrolase
MTRALTLSLFVIFAFCGVATSQPDPSFKFSFRQPFGKYAVGLKVVQQSDLERSFSAESGKPPNSKRPLQTLIWYPAIRGLAPPMVLGDFEDLIAHETSFDEASPHGPSQDFVHAFMQGTESQRTISFRDATPEQHRFPVIVYAPSLNAPNFENIELCEYLASNGFVVLASPSMGASVRHMQVDASDAAGQAADILFLIKFAQTLSYADVRKVAVVGYSWGGTGALLAAVGDPPIRALVALDGSFRYEPPSNVDAGEIKIPLLFFSRGETPLATPTASDSPVKQDPRALNDWTHGDVLQIRMLGISHIQFSSLYQRSERFKREGMQFVPAGYSLADGDESYGWIARYTMEFLKDNFEHDRSARAFLMRTPSDNGVPSRLMVTSFRPAARR